MRQGQMLERMDVHMCLGILFLTQLSHLPPTEILISESNDFKELKNL